MNVYVAMANGFEEIEAIAVVDILRRAGIDLRMFSISGNKIVEGAHGIRITAEYLFDEIDFSKADMLILPGGLPGTTYLREHEGLNKVIKDMYSKDKWLAAICAAPTVYGSLGLLDGRKSVCYPGCENGMGLAEIVNENVVVDGHFVTSKGPGTAMYFGLKLVEILAGKEMANKLKNGMLIG